MKRKIANVIDSTKSGKSRPKVNGRYNISRTGSGKGYSKV